MPHDSPLPGSYTPRSVEGSILKGWKISSSLPTKGKKAKIVISDEEEELVSEDSSKQGMMEETRYAYVEEENARVEYDFDLTEQQVTQVEEKRLFSTAGDIQDTDEELAKKVQEEEQTKILEQKEQERANLEAALNLQKLFDQERKATDDIAWSKIVEQAQLKISGVGNITEAYQGFEDMLKAFDREDLDTLWSLVKEKFRSVEPNEDMERALWVELKRIYEPDKEDTLTLCIFNKRALHLYATRKGLSFDNCSYDVDAQ
ncbi:hypothetical protein Tco_1348110 [Tanacetum coccineum]